MSAAQSSRPHTCVLPSCLYFTSTFNVRHSHFLWLFISLFHFCISLSKNNAWLGCDLGLKLFLLKVINNGIIKKNLLFALFLKHNETQNWLNYSKSQSVLCVIYCHKVFPEWFSKIWMKYTFSPQLLLYYKNQNVWERCSACAVLMFWIF